MSIQIREKGLSKGYVSIYLDIHQNGRRYYKFLGLKFKDKPITAEEKNNKKECKLLAKKIASKIQLEGLYNEYGIDQGVNAGMDFFAYAQTYMDKHEALSDLRGYSGVINKLKAFARKERLSFYELNESLMLRFSKYLYNQFKGETGYGYFKKLRRIIKEAMREKIIKFDPTANVKVSKKRGRNKDVLTFNEIGIMAKAYCGNDNVKRAFLLSCITGLRYSDVKNLKWKNVRGKVIDLIQQKTKQQVSVALNSDACELLGLKQAPDDRVFNLPSHTACLKLLRNWTIKAGIEKHITWHCSRHSFGTNLVAQGTDVLTASKLLGHTSVKSTERYVRISDGLKTDAVDRFPSFLK